MQFRRIYRQDVAVNDGTHIELSIDRGVIAIRTDDTYVRTVYPSLDQVRQLRDALNELIWLHELAFDGEYMLTEDEIHAKLALCPRG